MKSYKMSSVPESKTMSFEDKKKSPYSVFPFDKFPYTVYASVQVAGSVLTQESLLQLIDTFVCRSRIMIQKTTLYLFDYKMFFAVLLFWLYAFTKFAKLNNPFERKLTEEQPKPHKSAVAEVQPKAVVPEAVSETETGTKSRTLQFIPEVDATAHPRLLRVTSNSNIPVRQNFGLVVIVYASASLVYIQFMLLAVFLQSTTTPPGLVFLVSSLGYIGFIVFQICFVKAKTKEDGSVTAKKAAKPKSIPAHSRLIRSTTRRFLYFHNKTLSKIKLL